MLSIQARDGYYEVYVDQEKSGAVYFVDKQRACSCGQSDCAHVDSVAAYLKAGGRRAAPALLQGIATQCPICDALTDGRVVWRCSTGGYVCYFKWLDETVHDGAVRKWFTERWEGKASAPSPEEIEAMAHSLA